MGYGIRLSDNPWDELDRIRFSAGSAEVFRNCLIILMSHSSDTIESIAERLGCGTDTVKRVRRLYRQGGASALRPIKPPGRPGRATPEYLAQMRLAVQANPMNLGYGFSVWSAKRLAEHLAKGTRIRRDQHHRNGGDRRAIGDRHQQRRRRDRHLHHRPLQRHRNVRQEGHREVGSGC